MVVIYARVSNRENISSIKNQVELCKFFASNNKLVISNIYTDIGFSGSNYNRPNFRRLIEDITDKKISTVLVKDISRIGRSFLETSYYIEEFFVKYQVKLISLNDDLDNEMLLPIKNYLNDLYVKECRKKRNKYIESHKEKVLFSNTLIYGYTLKNEKIEIVIDEAKAVKLIFNRYLNNYSIKDIIFELSNSNFYVPGFNKKGYKIKDINKYNWKSYMIYRILNSKEYTGCGINLKTRKIHNKKIKNTNTIELANKYPVIISLDDYMKVQNKLSIHRHDKKISLDKELNIINNVYDILLNCFRIEIKCLQEEVIKKYRLRKMQKSGYFKEINKCVNRIKEILDNNEGICLLEKYNNQINNMNYEIDIEVISFINFLNHMDIELIRYLVDEIKISQINNIYQIKVFYKYSI